MIYLDNGATTYPKPPAVRGAMANALYKYGANPGRGGHQMSIDTAEMIFSCRQEASDFFGADGAECVIFQPGCTQAINTVVKGVLKKGDQAVISDLEHNAVTRPLSKLEKAGVIVKTAKTYPGDLEKTLNSFKEAIGGNTKLVVCTQGSNVFGIRLPVEEIAVLAHKAGAKICVDAAQSAGIVPIDMQKSGIDYLCVPGHKGLYGPMGIGLLIMHSGDLIDTLVEGGTGTQSTMQYQPSDPPERYESGTQNVPGIAGLRAGMEFIRRTGMNKIYRHEMGLINWCVDMLDKMPFAQRYNDLSIPGSLPVLSFNVKGALSEDVGEYLAKRNIAVRCGLHCAPSAHDKMGTKDGTVRIVPSYFTTRKEIEHLISCVYRFYKRS